MINTNNRRQTHRLRVINDFQLEPFLGYPILIPLGPVSSGGRGRSCDQAQTVRPQYTLRRTDVRRAPCYAPHRWAKNNVTF